jgi:hypothetical protein
MNAARWMRTDDAQDQPPLIATRAQYSGECAPMRTGVMRIFRQRHRSAQPCRRCALKKAMVRSRASRALRAS